MAHPGRRLRHRQLPLQGRRDHREAAPPLPHPRPAPPRRRRPHRQRRPPPPRHRRQRPLTPQPRLLRRPLRPRPAPRYHQILHHPPRRHRPRRILQALRRPPHALPPVRLRRHGRQPAHHAPRRPPCRSSSPHPRHLHGLHAVLRLGRNLPPVLRRPRSLRLPPRRTRRPPPHVAVHGHGVDQARSRLAKR